MIMLALDKLRSSNGMIEDRKRIVNNFSKLAPLTTIGLAIASTPKTNPRFAMFDPNRFPIDILTLFERIADNETANSGTLVTTESRINPITRSPNFVILVSFTEFPITIWLNFDKKMRESKNNKDWLAISINMVYILIL